MKSAIIAVQAIATLLSIATPAVAESFKTSRPVATQTCTGILAGMANDAKADPSVSVTYTGVELLLVGNGRHYAAQCKNGRIFFSGSSVIE